MLKTIFEKELRSFYEAGVFHGILIGISISSFAFILFTFFKGVFQ